MSDLLSRATEQVDKIIRQMGRKPAPERIGRLSWLDGYASGHCDATNRAIQVMGETPFGDLPAASQIEDEDASIQMYTSNVVPISFVKPQCAVCRGRGCEFCPKVGA